MKNNRIALSPADRATARAIIARHPKWRGEASRRGINTAGLSGNILYEVADVLGIDVQAELTALRNATRAAAPAIFGNAGKGEASGVPASVDWARVRRIAAEEAAERIKPVIVERVVVVREQDGTRETFGELTHPEFPTLLELCTLLAPKDRNILLVGPAGTGKTTAALQLGKALARDVVFQSIALEPAELVGYVDLHGKQKITPFVDAFQHGKVCLLDEMDRYSDKAMVALNAALANRLITLDNGEQIKAHPDFICIGSANTFGTGPDAAYTSAERLDRSTQSRFQAKLAWGVVPAFEIAVAEAAWPENKGEAAATARHIQKARAALEKLDLHGDAVADQRTILTAVSLVKAGWAIERIEELTFLAPLDEDQRKAVRSAMARNA
jgi:MoxR-like ATPase